MRISTPDLTRTNDVLAIRKLYADDEVFKRRQIPKYYHVTLKMQYFKEIIEAKHILATNASYPGAWTANGRFFFFCSFSPDPVQVSIILTRGYTLHSHFLLILKNRPRKYLQAATLQCPKTDRTTTLSEEYTPVRTAQFLTKKIVTNSLY